MKKILCLVIALLIFPAWSLAEIDLKSMTVEELVSLKAAIAEEMLSRGELKEVSVPAGEYTVGEDIPAGNYSVKTASSMATLIVNSYEKVYVLMPDSQTIGKLVLAEGDKVELSATCIFTVYAGLGF